MHSNLNERVLLTVQMPGLLEIAKDVSREYRITNFDALELLRFITDDMTERLARGEYLKMDRFCSLYYSDGELKCRASSYMAERLKSFDEEKAVSNVEDEEQGDA